LGRKVERGGIKEGIKVELDQKDAKTKVLSVTESLRKTFLV